MNRSTEPHHFPEGYVFVEEFDRPEEKARMNRELWCLWSRRDLLPMVLPKDPTNTTLAELRKEL